jgi:hypothetical protein
MAMGGDDKGPTAEELSGGNWSSAGTGLSPAGTGAVSCTSSQFCVTVGVPSGQSTNFYFAQEWNGKRWSTMPAALPPTYFLQVTYSVSCVSPTFCVAVGQGGPTGTPNDALAYLGWNGTVWSSMPKMNFQSAGFLYGVSCTSTTFCVAVGFADDRSNQAYWVEWNGTVWSPMTPPSDADAPVGVSCVSQSFCMAVAHTSGETNLVASGGADEWNGTTWSSTTGSAGITDLSCVSASLCVAAGPYNNSPGSPPSTGTMTWNGSTWIPTSMTGPGDSGEFGGISCFTTPSCVAVGDYVNGSTDHPLAEQWTA